MRRRTLALLALSCALTLSPMAARTAEVTANAATVTTRPPESGPVWPRRLTVDGDFHGLAVGAGALYSLQDADRPERSRAVRVDERNGHLTAVSAILPAASNLAFVGGTLVVAGATSVSKNLERFGRSVLYVLGPTTLRRAGTIALPGPVAALAADPRLLWLAVPTGLVEIDPKTDRVIRTVATKTTLMGLAIDPSDDRLYDIDAPSGNKPQMLRLEGRDASDGRLVATSSIPYWPDGFTLAASGDSLFAATGDPGASGVLFRYRTAPLRLVSASFTEGGGGSDEIGGATGPALPSFGQFPVVDASAGEVYVSSDDELACFSPRSGRLEAITAQARQPVVTGPIVRTGKGTYAIANFEQPSGVGIVRLSPPVSCS